MKKLIPITLVISMLICNICYAAAPVLSKEETVYVNLDDYGKVKEINIYNKCTTNGTNEIEDYTSFKEITNLTNRNEISKSGEVYYIDTKDVNNFSYTGKVGEEYYNKIPWKFDISYKLNGVEIEKEKLLGAVGIVEIIIDISSNTEALDYYRNNYMLEITGSYDMSKYLSIESDEAMVANTGNTKTLMMIVLPGQSTTLHIRIGTENFEMDGITMAMVPLAGDILEKVTDIIDDKDEIEDALDALNLSADIILNSLGGMQTGLNGVSAGITEIQTGTETLHGLKDTRNENISNLKNVLIEIKPLIENTQKDLDNLKETYQKFIEFFENINISANELYKNIKELNEDLEEIYEIAEELPDDVATIRSTLKTLSSLCDNLRGILGDVSAMQGIDTEGLAKNLNGIAEATKEIATSTSSLNEEEAKGAILLSVTNIKTNLEKIQSTLKDMNKISSDVTSEANSTSNNLKKLKSELLDLSKTLSSDDAETFVYAIGDFNKLAKELEDMLDTSIFYSEDFLSSSGEAIDAIDNGKEIINKINDLDDISVNMLTNVESMLESLSNEIYLGANKTADSLKSVNNQLIKISSQSQALINSKNKVKNIIDDRIDELEEKTTLFNLDGDAETISFGSEKNKNVSKVEFLIKTPDIKKIQIKTEDLEKQNTKTTFWDRVMLILNKLFGWIFKIF